MSLAAQLDKIRAGGASRIPEDKRAIMGAATEALRQSGLVDGAIKPGDALPPFELENAKGEVVRSADLLAKGPLVLTVFRGVW